MLTHLPSWTPSAAYLGIWLFALLRYREEALNFGSIALAVSVHALVIFQEMYVNGQPHAGFAMALSATSLSCMICYLWGGLFERIGALRYVLLPVAALMAALPMWFPSKLIEGVTHPTLFVFHLGAALFAYGSLAFAVSLALAVVGIDAILHQVRARWLRPWLMRAPPLLSLERLMFRVIDVAFVALSLTLCSGIFFSDLLHLPLRSDHKTLFSLVAWGILAMLLIGRRRYGWRGRTAIMYVLAGFLALMLAYVGTQFVLQMILHRA